MPFFGLFLLPRGLLRLLRPRSRQKLILLVPGLVHLLGRRIPPNPEASPFGPVSLSLYILDKYTSLADTTKFQLSQPLMTLLNQLIYCQARLYRRGILSRQRGSRLKTRHPVTCLGLWKHHLLGRSCFQNPTTVPSPPKPTQ